ncbi:PNISR family protein [Megaselia abdita]
MYSGNGEQFANWQMAAQAQISNLSANNIDWASLAAQWINMRETTPQQGQQTSELLDAPPPPIISSKCYHPKAMKHLEEQGEAEMDMADSDEDTEVPVAPSTSSFTPSSQFETIPLQLPVSTPRVQPVLNYHLTQYQSQQDWQWPPRVQLPPPVLHIPQVSAPEATSSQEQQEKPETLDENKRKSLPAWLREGLEKMEKEKRRQIDREKDQLGQDSTTSEKSLRQEKEIKSLVKNTLQEMASDKSDSESEADAVYEEETAPPESPLVTEETTDKTNQEMVKKSQEEIIEEMMLVVRRSLTELLLEVTNEEILSIAQEQYKRKKLKASTSVQVFHKSALSAITGNLGLGAYDDSSDEDDSDNDNSDLDNKNNGVDSEDEIKTNLRLARKNFRSIEQSIEDFLLNDQQQQEKRKEEAELITQSSKASTPERIIVASPVTETSKKDIGETQPDKRYHGNGKRNKERTSRFSENKATTATTFFVQPHQSTASSTSLMVPQNLAENPLFNAKVASPTRKRRRSDSSDDDRRSNSSKSSSKYSYKSSRSTYRHKKSSRRSDDDSDDYYSGSRHSKKSRHKHKRSRSRSRSRSKSSYSSSSSKRRR